MKFTKVALLAFSLAVLSACSTLLVPTAPAPQDARAKLFRPVSGKAVLYVYREKDLLGGDDSTSILIDGQVAATGARNRFNVIVLNPGEYQVGVRRASQIERPRAILLRANVDRVYYAREVWVPPTGFRLYPTPASVAQPAIRQGKLIERRHF